MSNTVSSPLSGYLGQWTSLFDRFWFRPADPAVLSLLRLMAGIVIFYTHLAWTLELDTFFGSHGVLPATYRSDLSVDFRFAWSHFDWLPNDHWLMPVHLLTLAVMLLFTLGLWTRSTGILTAFFVISYANRATGALFGLDQVNAFLAIYLAIGPSGARFSIDNWLRKRQGRGAIPPSIMANIAIRLIQIHLCIVYFFAGVGKLQGDTWWNGMAIWYAFASHEYQTLDMTWTAQHLWLVNLLTYVSLFWEVSYPFLIWPRLTRPIWIMLAIAVHLGIGLAMGMMTFGYVMIVANMSFLRPEWFPTFWPSC
ncbi:MAG: HTTM domain-containing protein [Pirellulaceae bacterium]